MTFDDAFMNDSSLRDSSHVWREAFLPPPTFVDPQQEFAFLTDYARRFAPARRISAMAANAGWAIYLGWDVVIGRIDPHITPLVPQLVAVRVLGMVWLLFCLYLTMRPEYASDHRFARRWIMNGCWGIFLVSYALMWIAPFPYNYVNYFFCIFIIIVFASGPLHLLSRDALTYLSACALSHLFYVVWHFYFNQERNLTLPELLYPWATCYFMMTLTIVGAMVNNQLERSERTLFQRQTELETQYELIRRRNKVVEDLAFALQQSKEESERHWSNLLNVKEQLRQAAEQRNREKSAFLANAVHDLRQPIQAIGNALDPVPSALAQRDHDSAQNLVALALMAVAAMRVQLNNTLDLSRLESGVAKAELQDMDLVTVVRHAVAQASMANTSHEVSIRFEADADLHLPVRSDAQFIKRIVLNLVSNAVKYADKTKAEICHARVSVIKIASGARLDVSDNGKGIPQALLDSGDIFKPFFQFNNQLAEAEKGVGLGLSIVLAMVALLPGHELSIRSELGHGTTFSLFLPAAKTLPAWPHPSDFSEIDTTPLPDLQGLKLLFVEDDELVRNATLAMFRSHGLQVAATGSVAGLRSLIPKLQDRPNVLLCDYRLPDGQTVLDVMQLVNMHFGQIKLVILSGESQDFSQIEGLAGTTVLRKPVSSAQLLITLAQVYHQTQG